MAAAVRHRQAARTNRCRAGSARAGTGKAQNEPAGRRPLGGRSLAQHAAPHPQVGHVAVQGLLRGEAAACDGGGRQARRVGLKRQRCMPAGAPQGRPAGTPCRSACPQARAHRSSPAAGPAPGSRCRLAPCAPQFGCPRRPGRERAPAGGQERRRPGRRRLSRRAGRAANNAPLPYSSQCKHPSGGQRNPPPPRPLGSARRGCAARRPGTS